MDIIKQVNGIWKELHRYGRIVSDKEYTGYRVLTYYYNLELYEVILERGMVTRIEIITH